jgi:hypothetical protein
MSWNDTISCHLQQGAAIYRQEFRRFSRIHVMLDCF